MTKWQFEQTKDQPKNYIELAKRQIFEKIREEIFPIQNNLSEKKITIDEAKNELQKINEWLQWSNIENKDKKELWNAFNKLTKNLEKNIDENNLQAEFNEIVNLLETLTNKELARLKQSIPKTQLYTPKRPPEVIVWVKKSSNDLIATINEASKDSNIIARTIGSRMKKLIS